MLYNIFISHFTIIIIWWRQGTSTKLIYSFRRKMIAICKTQININLNDSLATRTQPMVNGPCNFFSMFQLIYKYLHHMHYTHKKTFFNNFLFALHHELLQLKSLCICPHLWVHLTEFWILLNRYSKESQFKILPNWPRLIM